MSEHAEDIPMDPQTGASFNSVLVGTLSSAVAQLATLSMAVDSFTTSCQRMAKETASLITTLDRSLDEVLGTLTKFSLSLENLRYIFNAKN